MNRRNGMWGLVSLGLLLASVSAGMANPKQVHQAAQKAAKQQAQATQVQIHATLITELQQIHTYLANAKHDYNGHRASAVSNVHSAMSELHKEMGHFNKQAAAQVKLPKPALINSTQRSQEDQAVSDKVLAKGVADLTTVHQQVQGLSKGPHHAQVLQHLTKAVHELNTALKVR
jgi:hypothetical protein